MPNAVVAIAPPPPESIASSSPSVSPVLLSPDQRSWFLSVFKLLWFSMYPSGKVEQNQFKSLDHRHHFKPPKLFFKPQQITSDHIRWFTHPFRTSNNHHLRLGIHHLTSLPPGDCQGKGASLHFTKRSGASQLSVRSSWFSGKWIPKTGHLKNTKSLYTFCTLNHDGWRNSICKLYVNYCKFPSQSFWEPLVVSHRSPRPSTAPAGHFVRPWIRVPIQMVSQSLKVEVSPKQMT